MKRCRGAAVVPPGPRALGIAALTVAMLIGTLVLACGTSSDSSPLDIATGAPRDSESVSLVDLESIRGDADLASIADRIEAALDKTLGQLGLSGTDLTGAMALLLANQRVFVAQGALSMDDLRQRMSQAGYLAKEVAGTEVLLGPAGNVALLGKDRLAVSSDFRALEVMVTQLKEKQYLESHEAAAAVLEHLPDGNLVSVTRDCNFVTRDCRAAGISLAKRDATLSDFTFVAAYDSDSDASNARDDAEELFSIAPGLYSEVTTQVIGTRFVAEGAVVTSEILGGIAEDFDLVP